MIQKKRLSKHIAESEIIGKFVQAQPYQSARWGVCSTSGLFTIRLSPTTPPYPLSHIDSAQHHSVRSNHLLGKLFILVIQDLLYVGPEAEVFWIHFSFENRKYYIQKMFVVRRPGSAQSKANDTTSKTTYIYVVICTLKFLFSPALKQICFLVLMNIS